MSKACDLLIVTVGCEAGARTSPLQGAGTTQRVLEVGAPVKSRQRQRDPHTLTHPAFRLHGAEALGRRELALVIAEVARRLGARMVVIAGAQDADELLGHAAKALNLPLLGQVAEVRGGALRSLERNGVQWGYQLSGGSGVAGFAVPENEVTPLTALEGAGGRPPARSLKIRQGRRNVAWITGGGEELGENPVILPGAQSSLTSRRCEPHARHGGALRLGDADVVIAAGAGVGSAEASSKLAGASERLGAAFGATRVVTDAGWAPEALQIGTTGVTIHPRLYVAIGISGATQHTGGIESPDQVIAINTDPGAQIFSIADRAILADAPSVTQALWELTLEETGEGGADDGR